MLKKFALACVMCMPLAFAGCQAFGDLTPEKTIAHALTANKVLAQCYADYQTELDSYNAGRVALGQVPVSELPLEPVAPEVGSVPIPTE